ncbi:MAG TPA: ATP-dependent DNA helicase [Casimicrobiaceae bacterium]|jgi:ATP-dependent DNA helicase DinG|nr:ATP-dependent DNA helicase [Casimicrobiaceae bacterium]
MTADLQRIFGPEGPLARELPAYRFRNGQLEMAEAIARAMKEGGQLLAEAGTGTGKTFAYLVPALLSGGKVIISTGTKTLQDQLFQRDLPLVRGALKLPLSIALLKGRANYVCLHHLERTSAEGTLASRADVRYLKRIESFARSTTSGDKAELADVPETASVWAQVTSTRDNCLGGECAHYDDCFVMNARREALAADVVVVNHHLFFADVVLRDEGLSELLPSCNTVILDEAHQLPETATLFFGEELTAGQLMELARDAEVEGLKAARDYAPLPAAAQRLAQALRELRLAAGEAVGKWPQTEALKNRVFVEALDTLAGSLAALQTELARQAERSDELAQCAQRAADAGAGLARWRSDSAASEGATPWIRWLEVTPGSWQLHASPLSVAEIFSRHVAGSARSWILTSATLAVGGDFSLYQRELGLSDAATGCWDSPFDYDKQALLYLPQGLPEPNSFEHTDAVVAAALPVLKASRGRAFLLFTTLRALARAREALAAALGREGLDYPLLVQGEGSRSELLARFRRLGNAVLLGSQSFWEGVDVQGEALSVVVIDKLPFAPPDDPLFAARLEHIARRGGNPFLDYQLPQAAISLKQGAGRLIRSESDRGVLMICDPRLADKPYGRRIWQALPPMRRTRELSEVVAFFDEMSRAPRA